MQRHWVLGILLALLIQIGSQAGSALAQRRGDTLNEQEIERIREAQEIDRRTDVFLRLASRRLDALEGRPDQPPKREAWGDPPTGSPRQLLTAYASLLEELADKLDAVAETKGEQDPKLRKALARVRHDMEMHITRLERLSITDDDLAARRTALQMARLLLDGASAALAK
ncbi:hypothetical protein J8C06_08445 [Chloracidobacterium validum]|uniref:Uncharacterized protein n=1 Tax=Chloracidobacterium validum TaxID=2821543 RepID=A0ABX8B9Q9_9BACT|nr:hypothetical protein [Chloracidobacterium validum]QUW02383.1 hypothetical protein J8C06_08445 [Chloracidobacterium validum]